MTCCKHARVSHRQIEDKDGNKVNFCYGCPGVCRRELVGGPPHLVGVWL